MHPDLGFFTLLDLDRIGVYEDRLWVLYSNICEEKVPLLGAVALGNRMGMSGAETATIHDSIDKAYDRQVFIIEPLTIANLIMKTDSEFNIDLS